MIVLFWKFFRPELYGAYLEINRIEREIKNKKRHKKKYSHLERQFYDVRARFEMLRNNIK